MSYEKITTIEEAYAINKQDMSCLPDVSMLPADEAQDTINSLNLKRVIRALNTDQETGEVWKPNYHKRPLESKYFAWGEVQASEEQPGGFAFSYSYYDYWVTIASVGSRLCLKDSGRVMHLHKHFGDLLVKCHLIIE